MPFDPAYLDDVSIDLQGGLSLELSRTYRYGFSALQLDAPPSGLADAVTAWKTYKALVDAKIAAKEAEENERRARAEAEEAAARTADEPEIERILAKIEAADPLEPEPGGIRVEYGGQIYPSGRPFLRMTAAQKARGITWYNAHAAALQAAKIAKKDAEQAERDARIAEHGGHYWLAEGGMCNFVGYDLWGGGQTRRWVGVFTEPKGVKNFLDNPRGEKIWDVRSLVPGDCVQGAGFDTNSRGKRRNESEFFGVVIRNDDTGLVIKMVSSRAAALKLSRKTKVA
jgi:hypothetical protein